MTRDVAGCCTRWVRCLWLVGFLLSGVDLTFGQATLTFERVPTEPSFPGATLQAMVAGDVDRDGKVDLVVADADGELLGVFFGLGDGTFLEPPSTYELTDYPGLRAVQLGDLNSDGELDLVAVSDTSNAVVVMLNQGAGVFGPPIAFSTGEAPTAIALGDWDKDGRLDVAAANNLDDTLSVFLGDGRGGLSARPTPIPVGSGPSAICVGDLNVDGRLDLVVASTTSGELSVGSVAVLAGDGGGGFSLVAEMQGEFIDTPVGCVLGDFNEDGAADIAVVNQDLDDIAVFLNGRNFTFSLLGNFPVAVQLNGCVTGDFDRDGHGDVACAGEFDDKAAVVLGSGDGSFGPPVSFDVSPAPGAIVAADFDRDQQLDLAVTSQDFESITILLNRTGGGGPTPTPTPLPRCVGDCGGDGEVTIDELITMVNIALGSAPVSSCAAGDPNQDEEITIDEIIQAVNRALTGCQSG
ncbi:MAG: VCBS repeat-containing protein [Candidatus Binatia bacterium]|nr:VCBS repeat-containing protein [Candidatus Binatia bacterium]